MVLFIMLYEMIVTFESVDEIMKLWMQSLTLTIQMKATEQYFPVVLFIMLYKLVLSFGFAYEILKFLLFK